MRGAGITCSQVDPLEAGGGDPVGEDVARDEDRGPDREDDQLRPDVLTHHVQVGAEEGNDVDQDLGETDVEQHRHARHHERCPDVVGRLVVHRQQQEVEDREHDQRGTEESRIGLDSGGVRFVEHVAQHRDGDGDHQLGGLEEAAEQDPGAHRVAFPDRQQHGEVDVVGLAEVHDGEEHREAHVHEPDVEGIGRDEHEEAERSHHRGKHQVREFEFLQQQVFHGGGHFRSRWIMMDSRSAAPTWRPWASAAGALSARISASSRPSRSRQPIRSPRTASPVRADSPLTVR